MAAEKSRDDVLARLEAGFLELLADPRRGGSAVEEFLGDALASHPEFTEEILGLVAVAEALDLADTSVAERLAHEEAVQASDKPMQQER